MEFIFIVLAGAAIVALISISAELTRIADKMEKD